MEVINLKKAILIVMFILAAIIGSFGIIKINEKGDSVSQHYDMNISDDILCDGDEVFEVVKSNTPALSYAGDSAKLGYTSDDLVYREYSSGEHLEKGYEILIEQDKIIGEVENMQNVVVVLNGKIYKEISFDNNDIEFTLEKSGNYVFLAIDSDGNSVDITQLVKVNISADGGAILLN